LVRDPEWVQSVRPDWTPAEVSEYVRTGQSPPDKIGVVDERKGLREPIRDHESIFDLRADQVFKKAGDAAREVKNFRQAQAIAQQQLLAELTAQEQAAAEAGPAVGQSQAAQPAEPTQAAEQPQQQQPDPIAQERAQLAAAQQCFVLAARATEAEREASAAINQWTEAFNRAYPEANNPNAIEELRTTNVQRFAAMQRDAQRVAQNIDSWMRQGAAATQQRQAVENQIAQHQEAQVRAAWHSYKEAEDAKFHQYAPELNDPVRASAMRQGVKQMLNEIGFDNESLARAWNGETGFSVRDHRAQRLILDAFRWRQAQANAKNIANKRAPVPPVQRPGVARLRGADNEADIARLQRELNSATGAKAVRLATRLHQLQRQAG
jgi:hypothetical protein